MLVEFGVLFIMCKSQSSELDTSHFLFPNSSMLNLLWVIAFTVTQNMYAGVPGLGTFFSSATLTISPHTAKSNSLILNL